MRKSNSQIVAELETARDNVLEAIASDATVVEIEIRGKKLRRENPYQTLMWIEKLIRYYGGSASGPARSQARLKRVK